MKPFALFCVLLSIPFLAFGLYFVGWEIYYKDFSDFLFSGIILLILGGLLLGSGIKENSHSKKNKKRLETDKQSIGVCTQCAKTLYPETSIEWNKQLYCTACFKPFTEKMFSDFKRMQELVDEITRLQAQKEQILQKRADQLEKITETVSSPAPSAKETSASRLLNYIEDEDGERWFLKYEYEKDICFIDTPAKILEGKNGRQLEFRPEPENTYDSGAIALYLDNQKIGYVYKGNIQDMIHDWIKRGDMFGGHIASVDVSANKATYFIGFYKTEEYMQAKEFDLIKTNKKDYMGNLRSERLCFCQKNDEVIIEYDSSADSYVVYDDTYDEIGELGTKFKQWEETISYNRMYGIISHISDDDLDNPKIKVFLA